MEGKLYEEGLERYPLFWVLGQNIFLLIYFSVAFLGMYPLQVSGIPAVSLLYIIFIGVMLLFVLRKHLCTNCYYYGKRCNTCWGKLASLLFERGSGNYELGGRLANLTWAFAAVIPIVGMILVLALVNFSCKNLGLLFLFIILSGVNFMIHRKSCEVCRMRYICPGSAAK